MGSVMPDLETLSVIVVRQCCVFVFCWMLLGKIFSVLGYDIPLWFCLVLYASVAVEYISVMRRTETLNILRAIEKASVREP